jgi:hypothetical protein
MTVLKARLLHRSGLLALGLGVALAIVASPASASEERSDPRPIEWTPPPGVVKITDCVPYMGEHWARREDMPLGPIYTVHKDRLISIEYMPSQEAFEDGKSWQNLTFRYRGAPLPIDHANIDFMPHGHEGYEVPHYDMHFYVVTREEERSITCR